MSIIRWSVAALLGLTVVRAYQKYEDYVIDHTSAPRGTVR